MDVEIGDFLFGYPIVGVTETTILIRLPGDMDIGFDRTQFNAGVMEALAEAGSFVKGPR